MSSLHVHMDPGWYLQKLWLLGVLFGGILILVTAFRNRRRNRKKSEQEN